MRWRVAASIGLAVLSGVSGRAAEASLAPEFSAPTPEQLQGIHGLAQSLGWAAQVPHLRTEAHRAYAHGELEAARAWFQVYRWSVLFAQRDSQFIPQWIRAVEGAGLAHAGMATQYRAGNFQFGLTISREFQAWLLTHPEFSEAFFALVQPVDFLPEVFKILGELHDRDPARFETYAALALAIAVVYDVPPPPDWPHRQVMPEALSRRWPRVSEAFGWWTEEDRAGRTYHRLTDLAAEELKFVVDTPAPLAELAWSQQVANYPLSQLESTYTMIAYREDRAAKRMAMWPEKSYTLPAILGAGGICVDQTYFATAAGKARGVPTLFFEGPGRDGRHAWFGFLNEKGKWQMDVGRYASQRLVTGFARDPQTWSTLSDHAIEFLAERFRTTESFRRSRLHADFSADFLAHDDAAAAVKAARRSIEVERRNQTGWEALLAAEQAQGGPVHEREATLRAAMVAFQRFPDLEANYSKRLSASLRARGETNEAAQEQQRVARKYQGSRSDLSVRQARDLLLHSIYTEPVREQVRAYNKLVDQYGRGAGAAFFDQIVVGFVEHLVQMGEPKAALEAMDRARRGLKVESGSQLDGDFNRLLKALKEMRP